MKVKVCPEKIRDSLVDEVQDLLLEYSVSGDYLKNSINVFKYIEYEIEIEERKFLFKTKTKSYDYIPKKIAVINVKNDDFDGKIIVYNSKVFDRLKKWGEDNNYAEIVKCWDGCI